MFLITGSVLTCPRCSKGYKTKNSLSVHLSRDCGLKPFYMCNTCKRTFRRKDYLNHHMLSNIECHRGTVESSFTKISDPEYIKKYMKSYAI